MVIIDHSWLLFPLSLILLVACVEIGFRFRWPKDAHVAEDFREEIGRTRDELAILLSLLLGFTLAMVLTRFDLRKELVVEEADAIEAVSLRAEMLPDSNKSKVKEQLSQYVDARLDFSKVGMTQENMQAALTRSKQIQKELWQQAELVADQKPTAITGLFVQSLNEMIELDTKRVAALENRIPGEIWFMLIALSLLLCLIVGHSQRRRVGRTMLITPLMIAIVMTLIADLDTPSNGLIQVGQKSLERVKADLHENSPGQ